jgi:hypothetical protein
MEEPNLSLFLAYKEAFSNEHLHGGGKLQQFEAVKE